MCNAYNCESGSQRTFVSSNLPAAYSPYLRSRMLVEVEVAVVVVDVVVVVSCSHGTRIPKPLGWVCVSSRQTVFDHTKQLTAAR